MFFVENVDALWFIFDGEMVKITPELVTKCPSQTKKKKSESAQQYLKRLTHVYLAEKSIDEIVSNVPLFLVLLCLFMQEIESSDCYSQKRTENALAMVL